MRDYEKIIQSMISRIPFGNGLLITELNDLVNKHRYSSSKIEKWTEAQKVLIERIPHPIEDWEFDVLSIFTELPIEQIKKK